MLSSTFTSRAQAGCHQASARRAAAPHAALLPASSGKCPTSSSAVACEQQRRSRAVLLRSANSPLAVTVEDTTSAATAAAPAKANGTGLQELNKDTFQAFMDAAGDKLVVVDYFTDRCGPCKMIMPQLVTLAAQLEPAATIVKFNCNQENKEMAKALGIKVVPTFHLFKNGKKIADMSGAKVDKLRALIDDHIKA